MPTKTEIVQVPEQQQMTATLLAAGFSQVKISKFIAPTARTMRNWRNDAHFMAELARRQADHKAETDLTKRKPDEIERAEAYSESLSQTSEMQVTLGRKFMQMAVKVIQTKKPDDLSARDAITMFQAGSLATIAGHEGLASVNRIMELLEAFDIWYEQNQVQDAAADVPRALEAATTTEGVPAT